ncbi:piggyBac transposable element-derived protein 5-like [Amphiura filiformis]|uniref:piggyBac transposable element-derived protein 5-like n=1 Tax=Amphiura filiformis TaxID=82378 RepID=UPI003B219883
MENKEDKELTPTCNYSVVIKEEPADHQDEDQSDQGTTGTDPISTINDNEEAFAWVYEQDEESFADTTPWRSSGELQWQADLKATPLKPFSETSGVCHSLHHNMFPNATPLDFFHLFVPKGIFATACKQTNNYADFYQDEKRDQGKEWWDWSDSYWIPADDEEELRTFLGICMVMGVRKLPHPQDYWSRHKNLRVKFVADAMSAERFSKLMQYFYMSNPWRDPERIVNIERRTEACLRYPLYKLSDNLWSSVLDGSKTLYNPHQDVILRELTASNLQSRKLHESDDLVWKLLTVEDASNGYIKNAEFHHMSRDLDVCCNSQTPFPSGSEVCDFLSDIAGRDHLVFADSVFISPETACKLTDFGFHVSANLSAWPAEFSDTSLSSMLHGEQLCRQYKQVVATASKTGSQVYRHLATFVDSQTEPSNDNMDCEDKMVSSPPTRHKATMKCSNNDSRYILSNSPLLSRMSKSEWKRLFWIVIDIALMNASVLWKETGRDLLSLSEFTLEVALGLIYDGSAKNQKGRGRSNVAKEPEIRTPVIPKLFNMQVNSPSSDNAEIPVLSGLEMVDNSSSAGLNSVMNFFRAEEFGNFEHSLVKFLEEGVIANSALQSNCVRVAEEEEIHSLDAAFVVLIYVERHVLSSSIPYTS